MACEVEYTDEFGDWWSHLSDAEQVDVAATINLLEARDVRLGFPNRRGSRVRAMAICANCGFKTAESPSGCSTPSTRAAILLIGGDKTGDDRFYEIFVPIADDLYDQHLTLLKKENMI
jgi:hypothetical protein